MKIVNSNRQVMEKYEQLKAFARAEILECVQDSMKKLHNYIGRQKVTRVLQNQGITFRYVG